MNAYTIDGFDPKTQAPQVPALDAADYAAIARGRPQDAPHWAELQGFIAPWVGGARAESAPAELSAQEQKALSQRAKTGNTLGVRDGFDGADVASSGWGIVFAKDDPQAPQLREQLKDLIAHRKAQATSIDPRRFRDDLVYASGTTKLDWLASYKAGPGRVDPNVLPYYLLLVGDLARMPWRFQSQLGVQHAVGRLAFDDLAAYKTYADNLLASEREGAGKSTREALYLCPQTDAAVIRAKANLLDPLQAEAAGRGWATASLSGQAAHVAAMRARLSDAPPRLWLSSTHGASQASLSTEADRKLQGALRCASHADGDWLSGDVVPEGCDLRGTISVHTACFGAGTPRIDSFAQAVLKGQKVSPKADAPTDLAAWLGQRLLGQPKGALALVGHVDRTCSTSWVHWGDATQVPNRGHFSDMQGRLLSGLPVGWALDPLGDWFAEKDSALRDLLDLEGEGEEVSDDKLAYAWLSAKDASGWVILGDPAARLNV